MKRRSIKTIITVLLALALLLSGCAKGSKAPDAGKDSPLPVSGDPAASGSQGQQASQPQAQQPAPEVKEPPYAAPHSTGKVYVPKNSISIDQYQEAADGPDDHYEGYYLQISGLKDKDIEARVNQRLKALYESVRDEEEYPDKEDLRARLKAFSYDRHDEYISENITASIGNILSVTCNHSESFTGDNDWLSYEDVKTLNLDLNTGNEISYTDLFADDCVGPGFIQQAVDAAVEEGIRRQAHRDDPEEEGSPEYSEKSALFLNPGQTAGHIGVNGLLKYYVSEYTGELMIVIDHDLPQFDTGFYYDVVSVPMEGLHAYDQRFYNGENIYESEEQAYCLFSRSLVDDSEYVYSDEVVMHNDVELTVGTSEYNFASFPEEWNEYLKLTPEQKDAMILQGKTFIDQVFGDGWGPDYLLATANFNNFALRYGNFTALTRDMYFSVSYNSPDFYQNLRSRDYYSTQLYYGDSTEPLELKDLFAEGVDYEALLSDAIRQSIDEMEPAYGYDEARMQAWLRFLLDDITGFYPNETSLVLIYDDITHHAVEFFPDDDELWKFSAGAQNVSYDKLGYKNLNIFR
ncbi:MAG: hypothetical protein IKR08_01045 [Firmicutes bacterium]|nr:hypothetical protein [Bacillota bacterium]